MKVKIVSSSTEGNPHNHYAVSIIIGDSICLDAGCIGFAGDPADQEKIRHLFLSHAHSDHTASLPIFLENVYTPTTDCPVIYAGETVHEWLQRDLFNDRMWPDFIRLSTPEAPFLERRWLEPGRTIEVEGHRITPIEVDHGVPAFGFIIEDDASAIVYSADTAATDSIWKAANETPNLRAVLLEASFPESLRWLADVSHHLTPKLFEQEVAKLERDVSIYPVLIKSRYRAETIAELEALGLPNMVFPPVGETFEP